ncbi:FG-GAP repeat [Carpediemonas membranifera]|uniref:FG-GAP repeat n=1 Tax=Carpediemonas membranifera TaxID=201153 RepID=A0A8J6DZ80_9EUKA|nr:FG-GAP repeat [Carpediemonas membranifera]|eukprot:KAG9390353.1 FG-GAP repeat [Carpediemonas membranifera]
MVNIEAFHLNSVDYPTYASRPSIGARGVDNNTGAVFVSTWTPEKPFILSYEHELSASNGADGDLFGSSLAMNNNGLLVVGAPGRGFHRGSIYAFVYDNGYWIQTLSLTEWATSTASYGADISMDDHLVVVGSPTYNFGKVFVYTISGETLSFKTRLTQPSGNFGVSVAVDSTYIAVGADMFIDPYGAQGGLVHLYRFNEKTDAWVLWEQFIHGEEGGLYGRRVALNSEMNLLAIGSPGSTQCCGPDVETRTGMVEVYHWYEQSASGAETASWGSVMVYPEDGARGDIFGGGSMELNGDVLVVGGMPSDSERRGAVYMYRISIEEAANDGNPSVSHVLIGVVTDEVLDHDNVLFGAGVTVDLDACQMLVGAPGLNGQSGGVFAVSFTMPAESVLMTTTTLGVALLVLVCCGLSGVGAVVIVGAVVVVTSGLGALSFMGIIVGHGSRARRPEIISKMVAGLDNTYRCTKPTIYTIPDILQSITGQK